MFTPYQNWNCFMFSYTQIGTVWCSRHIKIGTVSCSVIHKLELFHVHAISKLELFHVESYTNWNCFLFTPHQIGTVSCYDNNNRIQRRCSRFCTISSQRRELSPTRTPKWPGRNRAQTHATQSAYHLQVSCYVPLVTKGQLGY